MEIGSKWTLDKFKVSRSVFVAVSDGLMEFCIFAPPTLSVLPPFLACALEYEMLAFPLCFR